jgi:hypothetical protein
MPRRRYTPPELRSWSQEQAAVGKLLRALGWEVYPTSDTRRTRARPGIFDFICFKPGRVLFWDSKAGKAKLTKDQEEFASWARRAGCEVGWGDTDAVRGYHTPRGGGIELPGAS